MHPADTPDLLAPLDLPAEVRMLLTTSISNYGRHARVRLSVDTVNGVEVWCTAYQYAPVPDAALLTAKQLLARATEAFSPLKGQGLVPIISVCALEKGTPEKPITKHRSAADIELRGLQAAVLRQSPPRMLFLRDGDDLKLLALEKEASGHVSAQLAHKAKAWLARANYREGRDS